MTRIVIDPVSWTTHHLHLCFTPTDSVLSSATGFTYKHADKLYLITNWHNVTGRNPETGTCLSDTLAAPDIVSTLFRDAAQPSNSCRQTVRLYLDTELSQPAWYEHPQFGRKVDVVALPLTDLDPKYRLFPINDIAFDTEYDAAVADDAFVVGYPFADVTYAQLPIWKRASVASEPDVDQDGLPKMFLDTATRSGLSGSPVIMQRTGIHGVVGGVLTGSTSFGRIRNFVGVYSGRIGDDELKAQLGIVWKANVIAEIIEGRTLGISVCRSNTGWSRRGSDTDCWDAPAASVK